MAAATLVAKDTRLRREDQHLQLRSAEGKALCWVEPMAQTYSERPEGQSLLQQKSSNACERRRVRQLAADAHHLAERAVRRVLPGGDPTPRQRPHRSRPASG